MCKSRPKHKCYTQLWAWQWLRCVDKKLLTHQSKQFMLWCCCCCDSPAAHLLSSVVQVEEVCNCSQVVSQVLHYMTVEQMLHRVWCHRMLQTNIWYATGDAGLVSVQEATVTGTQLGSVVWTDRGSSLSSGEISGNGRSKDCVWYKIRLCF